MRAVLSLAHCEHLLSDGQQHFLYDVTESNLWTELMEMVRRGRSLDSPRMKPRLGFLIGEKAESLELGSDCVDSDNELG